MEEIAAPINSNLYPENEYSSLMNSTTTTEETEAETYITTSEIPSKPSRFLKLMITKK